MAKLSSFIQKRHMKRLNGELEKVGYPAWSGDGTTAKPNGCGEGYAVNLVNDYAQSDSEKRKLLGIITRVIG